MSGARIDTPVVVLAGGCSGEREVSLRSGAAVARALRDDGDGRGPAAVLEIEIRADGAWCLAGEACTPEEALARVPREALFFLALHGGAGEDGTIQGLLSACGRVAAGSGVAASALCMCKSWARSVLGEAGLRVAPGIVIRDRDWRAQRDELLRGVRALSAQGWVVKPDRGGSSVSTFVLAADEDPKRAIEAVLATGDRALVEARIHGVECTVGVLGNPGGPWQALTPVEIVPKPGRFFDYEEKYAAGGARELCPPESLPPSVCDELRALGVRAHRAADCAGYSRADFLVPRDAAGRFGTPVVLEINTLPGMTDRSLLPQAAAVDGWSFRALCLRILELAREHALRGRAVLETAP